MIRILIMVVLSIAISELLFAAKSYSARRQKRAAARFRAAAAKRHFQLLDEHFARIAALPRTMTREQLLGILRREFPLMSSRRLRFLTAVNIVQYFLDGGIEGCDTLNKTIRDYIEQEGL